MPPNVGVGVGSCALTRSIIDRRLASPFNRSVSRHDGSQDRSSSLGVLALVVALSLGACAGSKERGSASSGETYPFSGPVFVLTHEPPEPPNPAVTFLTGDIGEAVATARRAAGGKNLEILGADVAGQCLRRGLVDEILVYVLPVLLGDGIRFSSPGLARIDLEPVSSTRSGAVTILRFRVRR